MREQLSRNKTLFNSRCDVEALLNTLAIELVRMDPDELETHHLFEAVRRGFSKVKGSYSAACLVANRGLLAFRDPYGIRPALWGRRLNDQGSYDYAVASENVALDILGFRDIRDLEPGQVIFFSPGEEPVIEQVVEPTKRPCIFELVYFSRPDSILDRVSVYEARRRFGFRLAEKIKERQLDIDVVIPVPDSACTSASTLAQALGVDYREGLVKNRYIGRTFIMPNQSHRREGIRRKLNPIPLEFQGKDVLLVDDSIVRGNTSRKIIELARQAGANKVYFASCSPPVAHPCVYGVDMATRAELVARNRNEEEIAEQIGADLVIYQELEDLEAAAVEGLDEPRTFCSACFSGSYPTGDLTADLFESLENERLSVHEDLEVLNATSPPASGQ